MLQIAAGMVLALATYAPQADEEPTKVANKPKEVIVIDERVTVAPRTVSELTRVKREHDLLRGTWTIESMVDDGDSLSGTMIAEKVAENQRLNIGNRLIKLTNPSSGEARTWTYRLDPSTKPSRIEIVNDHDEEIPGIYRFDGDRVQVCLSSGIDKQPPTEFTAEAGSGRVLLSLKMVTAAELKAEEQSAAYLVEREQEAREAIEAERKAQETPPPRAPTAAEKALEQDRQIAKLLVGRWQLEDTTGVVTIHFNADGTVSASRNWDKALKRMFQGTTISNGTWRVSNAVITVYISGSTYRKAVNSVQMGRVSRIDSSQVIYTDALGRVNRAIRLP
jgi:uncharacterized protein (TIGR03067 family)